MQAKGLKSHSIALFGSTPWLNHTGTGPGHTRAVGSSRQGWGSGNWDHPPGAPGTLWTRLDPHGKWVRPQVTCSHSDTRLCGDVYRLLPMEKELMNILELPLLALHGRFTASSAQPCKDTAPCPREGQQCLSSSSSWPSSSFSGSETFNKAPALALPSPSPSQLLLAQLPQPLSAEPLQGPAQGHPQPLVLSCPLLSPPDPHSQPLDSNPCSASQNPLCCVHPHPPGLRSMTRGGFGNPSLAPAPAHKHIPVLPEIHTVNKIKHFQFNNFQAPEGSQFPLFSLSLPTPIAQRSPMRGNPPLAGLAGGTWPCRAPVLPLEHRKQLQVTLFMSPVPPALHDAP